MPDSPVDLRSDTVTRPTPAMLEAMRGARVGDDVLGEDETVNALQARAAELLGKEAALFCPSGTMTNQIGIRLQVEAGDEVLCAHEAHVYRFEGGGIAVHSRASVRPLSGDNGRFSVEQLRESVNRDDPHLPRTRLVEIENTVNRGGGCCWDLEEIRRIAAFCRERGLAFHLDGARLFNATVARRESPRQYAELFDTVSICLSKGLGAPVGSLLLGSRELIRRAFRIRKVMGGGMRQAGFLAAAGLYALEHNVARLAEDHARARALEKAVRALPFVSRVLPAETNIVIFDLAPPVAAEALLAHLKARSVLAHGIGPRSIRMVLHLDVDDAGLERALAALKAFSP